MAKKISGSTARATLPKEERQVKTSTSLHTSQKNNSARSNSTKANIISLGGNAIFYDEKKTDENPGNNDKFFRIKTGSRWRRKIGGARGIGRNNWGWFQSMSRRQ